MLVDGAVEVEGVVCALDVALVSGVVVAGVAVCALASGVVELDVAEDVLVAGVWLLVAGCWPAAVPMVLGCSGLLAVLGAAVVDCALLEVEVAFGSLEGAVLVVGWLLAGCCWSGAAVVLEGVVALLEEVGGAVALLEV